MQFFYLSHEHLYISPLKILGQILTWTVLQNVLFTCLIYFFDGLFGLTRKEYSPNLLHLLHQLQITCSARQLTPAPLNRILNITQQVPASLTHFDLPLLKAALI